MNILKKFRLCCLNEIGCGVTAGQFFMIESLLTADFFPKLFFSINSFRNTIECQTVWIQIRPGFRLGLIWVQTVCKGYQQMTEDVFDLEARLIILIV